MVHFPPRFQVDGLRTSGTAQGIFASPVGGDIFLEEGLNAGEIPGDATYESNPQFNKT